MPTTPEPALATEPAPPTAPTERIGSDARNVVVKTAEPAPGAGPSPTEGQARPVIAVAAEAQSGEHLLGGSENATVTAPTIGERARLRLPRTAKARLVSAVLVGALVALVAGGAAFYHDTHVPSDAAFRVYGQNVLISQLDDRMRTEQALFGVTPPPAGPQLVQFRKDLAQSAAMSTIVDHAAAQRDIVLADRQVSDTLGRYVTQVYGPGEDGHTQFLQRLASQGSSEPEVLAELKQHMTMIQLGQQVTGGEQVSDQQLQRYFTAHQPELGTPQLRDLHNLVVATQAQAAQIAAQLRAGANFEQLAQQDSLDTTTKDHGGELGKLAAGQLEPAYAQAAFSAPVSGIFGPVQTSHGWNVGKVVSITPPVPAVFAQITAQLRQQLLEQHQAAAWRSFLIAQLKDAHVVYNPVYRPAHPDTLPTPDDQQTPPRNPAPTDPTTNTAAPAVTPPAP